LFALERAGGREQMVSLRVIKAKRGSSLEIASRHFGKFRFVVTAPSFAMTGCGETAFYFPFQYSFRNEKIWRDRKF
jgi:hypothetical protein